MKKLAAMTLGAFIISGIVIAGSVTYAHGGHGGGCWNGRGNHDACYQNDRANCPTYNEDCPYYRGK